MKFVNDLLLNHSYGAIISKNGGIMWFVDYPQNKLFRIFNNIKYTSYYIDSVNNNIYIYL